VLRAAQRAGAEVLADDPQIDNATDVARETFVSLRLCSSESRGG